MATQWCAINSRSLLLLLVLVLVLTVVLDPVCTRASAHRCLALRPVSTQDRQFVGRDLSRPSPSPKSKTFLLPRNPSVGFWRGRADNRSVSSAAVHRQDRHVQYSRLRRDIGRSTRHSARLSHSPEISKSPDR